MMSTLPRRLICLTSPDVRITRMQSPQVDEVLWVAMPLTDPSVLEYINPLASFRWASSADESGAHKPGQRRQVSIRVSKVSITENRPERAQQEDDPHGLLTHGPNWTNRQNDPHGLLANRPKSAHKQGTPPGTLTTKGTQPTHVHDDNPSRATPSKPGAQAGHPARDRSTERRYQ